MEKFDLNNIFQGISTLLQSDPSIMYARIGLILLGILLVAVAVVFAVRSLAGRSDGAAPIQSGDGSVTITAVGDIHMDSSLQSSIC